MFFIILGVIVWVALAFWPAVIARRKGYSFILFFVLSIFISWLITLIVVLFLKDRHQTAQDKADDKAVDEILAKEEG